MTEPAAPFDLPSTITAEGRELVEREYPGLLADAPRAFAFWTKAEDIHLCRLLPLGLTVLHVARLHGRTTYEIIFRLVEMEYFFFSECELCSLQATLKEPKHRVEAPYTCWRHERPLRLGRAEARYGLPKDESDPFGIGSRCRTDLFPEARIVVSAGCGISPDTPTERIVLFCDTCREGLRAWAGENDAGVAAVIDRVAVPLSDDPFESKKILVWAVHFVSELGIDRLLKDGWGPQGLDLLGDDFSEVQAVFGRYADRPDSIEELLRRFRDVKSCADQIYLAACRRGIRKARALVVERSPGIGKRSDWAGQGYRAAFLGVFQRRWALWHE
jgi:hypothetical protein